MMKFYCFLLFVRKGSFQVIINLMVLSLTAHFILFNWLFASPEKKWKQKPLLGQSVVKWGFKPRAPSSPQAKGPALISPLCSLLTEPEQGKSSLLAQMDLGTIYRWEAALQ